jgi:hypothetical protein
MKKVSQALIFFLLISGLYASSVRIIGTGSLDLIVEDESNKLNLFDYGGNIAGLYNDERGSSVETYLAYGESKHVDKLRDIIIKRKSWGFYEPKSWKSLPFSEPIHGFLFFTLNSDIPSGVSVTHRFERGFALSYSDRYFQRRVRVGEGAVETEINTTIPAGTIIISKELGRFSAGLSGGYKKVELSSNGYKFSESLKEFRTGFVTRLSPMLDVGVSGVYSIPKTSPQKFDIGDIKYKGRIVSGGIQAITRIPGLIKVGTKVNYTDCDLNEQWLEPGDSIVEDTVGVRKFDFDLRFLFSSILFPVKIGANFGYRKLQSDPSNEYGYLNYNQFSRSVVNFGFGFSYELPYFTPGMQYDLYNWSETAVSDSTDIITHANLWEIKLGVEKKIDKLILRGGYFVSREDPNREEEDDRSETMGITTGAGIAFPMKPYRIEFAYVRTKTKLLEDPQVQITNNSIYSSFKLPF